MDCNGGFLNQTGVVKVKRLCWNHILGNFRNYENSCSMVHLPDAFNLSFFYLTFNQQPNSCFTSGIKALPSQYLLFQCEPAMETLEKCVK